MTVPPLTRLAFVSIALALTLAACAPAAPAAPLQSAEKAAAVPELLAAPTMAPAPTAAPKPAEESGNVQTAPQANVPIAAPRMVVRTAELVLVVESTLQQVDRINRLAEEFGGYVVSSSTANGPDGVGASMTIRVDSTQYAAALSRVRGLAVEVKSETSRGEDVTAEFVDLQARVRNLEVMEAQLQEFYKRATSTPDLLSTYNQAMEVRGQIEQAKGRMTYLSAMSAQSTINITLLPLPAIQEPTPTPTPAPWSPGKVFDDASNKLIEQSQDNIDRTIWFMVAVLPQLLMLLAPFALIVVLVVRVVRRRPAAKATISVEKAPEA